MLQVSSGVVLRLTILRKCDAEIIENFKNCKRKVDCALGTCWPVTVPIAGALLGSC